MSRKALVAESESRDGLVTWNQMRACTVQAVTYLASRITRDIPVASKTASMDDGWEFPRPWA